MCDASKNLDNQFYQMDLIIDSSKLDSYSSSSTIHEQVEVGLEKLNQQQQQQSSGDNNNRLSLLGNQENSLQQLKIAGNGQRFTAHNIDQQQKLSNGNSSEFINSLSSTLSLAGSLHDTENRNSTNKIGN